VVDHLTDSVLEHLKCMLTQYVLIHEWTETALSRNDCGTLPSRQSLRWATIHEVDRTESYASP